MRVSRSAQGDTIEIQRAVERITADFQHTLPEGVVVQLTNTRSQAIIDRLDILVENGIFGLALVLLFLFLFLSARTAFWVAAGIPVAMAATIGLMYVFGITLNMISVFALIICLGTSWMTPSWSVSMPTSCTGAAIRQRKPPALRQGA